MVETKPHCKWCDDIGAIRRNDPVKPLDYCFGADCKARNKWTQTPLGTLIRKSDSA